MVGDSLMTIAKKGFLSKGTVQRIVEKFKLTGSVENRSGRGRKRKTTVREDRIIRRKIVFCRRKAAEDVVKEFEMETSKQVSTETIRNRMREAGYRGRMARKKPLVIYCPLIIYYSLIVYCSLIV